MLLADMTPQPYSWGDCSSLYSRGPIAGDPGYAIAINRIVLNPGAHGTPHRHHTSEYITFISGTGTIAIANRTPLQVRPQMTVVISPGTLHHVENTSETTQLVYVAIRVGTQGNAILDEMKTPHGCPPTIK
jgi:mannose-6-phosphate isomerase-like protein (cupin superfamily)